SVFNVTPGRIDVSMAGTTVLSGPGTLVYLRFLITGGNGTYGLIPTEGMFNEIYPPKHYTGSIAITAFPVLNVTPNTQTIVVGDNLQFYVSGSTTPPLTWGVTNMGVANISGTGLLTATAKGQTRVSVVDNVGGTDTTDAITICDLYVVAPAQALWPTPTDVPISPDRSVTGMGIYGYELRLSFDPAKVAVTGVNTTGCSTAPWGTPVYNAGISGQVIVVHAGATPLSGSLPLVNITFQVLVTGVSASALTITKILFNEGDPCALVVNGSLSIPTAVSDQTPRAIDLEQNVPNPFNPTTTIGYTIADPGRVRLHVYNTAGILVRTLVERTHEAGGRFEARWDGTDDAGRHVATGVYLYRLETAGQQVTKKMVLLK
ncbi:MAG: Ig-like domain-containing protein, partial [Candidatus Krumholzibacteria bacterium]|nr:Ig-like domain-containing protein [Candidatus Krumholzibacteria bacterium]